MSSRVGSSSGSSCVWASNVSLLSYPWGEAAIYYPGVVVCSAVSVVGIRAGWSSSTILILDVTSSLSCSYTSFSPGCPDVVLWATGSV